MTYYVRITNIPSKLGVFVITELKNIGMNGYEGYEGDEAFALLCTEDKEVYRKAVGFLKFVGIQFTTYEVKP